MSSPPSPPTPFGALPDSPPPRIVEAAVSPPVVYSAKAPMVSIVPVEVWL